MSVCRDFPLRRSRSGVRSTPQTVSRDVTRVRECPPVPKCTRLVLAQTRNLAIAGNTTCPYCPHEPLRGFARHALRSPLQQPAARHAPRRALAARRVANRALAVQGLLRRLCNVCEPSRHRTNGVKTPTVEWDELSGAVRGEVVLPASAAYDDVRKPAMARFDHVMPAAIVRGTTSAEMSAAIGFARRAGVQLGIRCGGHSVAG